jgi:hypothetical protein
MELADHEQRNEGRKESSPHISKLDYSRSVGFRENKVKTKIANKQR